MAVPKKKTSKARRNKRRAQWKIEMPGITNCPQCGNVKLQHRACRKCGQYNKRQVLKIETSEAASR